MVPPGVAYAVRLPSGPRALTDRAEALLRVQVFAYLAALLTAVETRRRRGRRVGLHACDMRDAAKALHARRHRTGFRDRRGALDHGQEQKMEP